MSDAISKYFPGLRFVEPISDSDPNGAHIVDASGSIVAKLFWPCHPVEETQAAEQSTYELGRAMASAVELKRALAGRTNDAKSMELQRDQALRECDGLREALRWALENGAHYFNGTLFTETDQESPAHLTPILAEAMRSKS